MFLWCFQGAFVVFKLVESVVVEIELCFVMNTAETVPITTAIINIDIIPP